MQLRYLENNYIARSKKESKSHKLTGDSTGSRCTKLRSECSPKGDNIPLTDPTWQERLGSTQASNKKAWVWKHSGLSCNSLSPPSSQRIPIPQVDVEEFFKLVSCFSFFLCFTICFFLSSSVFLLFFTCFFQIFELIIFTFQIAFNWICCLFSSSFPFFLKCYYTFIFCLLQPLHLLWLLLLFLIKFWFFSLSLLLISVVSSAMVIAFSGLSYL